MRNISHNHIIVLCAYAYDNAYDHADADKYDDGTPQEQADDLNSTRSVSEGQYTGKLPCLRVLKLRSNRFFGPKALRLPSPGRRPGN